MSLTTSTAAWLYVKDDYTSVRMHAQQVNGTFQLFVCGPSHQRLFYDGLDALTYCSGKQKVRQHCSRKATRSRSPPNVAPLVTGGGGRADTTTNDNVCDVTFVLNERGVH